MKMAMNQTSFLPGEFLNEHQKHTWTSAPSMRKQGYQSGFDPIPISWRLKLNLAPGLSVWLQRQHFVVGGGTLDRCCDHLGWSNPADSWSYNNPNKHSNNNTENHMITIIVLTRIFVLTLILISRHHWFFDPYLSCPARQQVPLREM